jgi:regulator of replication initiation timing
VFGYVVIRKCLALNDVHGMERMNDDIPFEHQMMFIVKDYDRKVEENMELRKEVEELSAALEKQGVQLHDAKVDLKNEIKKEEEAEKALKKKPTFDEKVLQKQMTDLKKKNKILSKQVNQLHRTLQYVRNRTWTLLEENFIPELEKLELQMRETLEKYEEMAWDLHQK